MRSNLLIAAAVLFLIQPARSLADSDGYFCAGTGYLAYEISFSENLEHTLFVVHFGPEIGIAPVKSVRLEDFQVHGMRCGDGIVEILGPFRSHFFDISDRDKAPIKTQRPKAATFADKPMASSNLGAWSKEKVIDLQGGNGNNRFQLVIAKVSTPVPVGVEHHTLTSLIQRDAWYGILHSKMLFNGISFEPVD